MERYRIFNMKQMISFEVEKHEENWDLGIIEARDVAIEKMKELQLLDGWGGNYSHYDEERLNYNRVRVSFSAPLPPPPKEM